MVKTVRARNEYQKQLYLVDESCEFVPSVKRYLDYLATLEKSPHTLENYCRHLCYYFTFLEQAHREGSLSGLNPFDRTGNEVNFSETSYTRVKMRRRSDAQTKS